MTSNWKTMGTSPTVIGFIIQTAIESSIGFARPVWASVLFLQLRNVSSTWEVNSVCQACGASKDQ